MITIGITGGVGAGKSTVLDFLAEKYQAYVMKADEIGHLVMEPGQECYEPVIALFGKQIIKDDKTIDRRQVSDVVFSHPDMLERLNEIIHPAVKRYIRRQLELKRQQGQKICVVEAALLLEDHYDAFCDEVWYIYADEAVRKKRLKDSRQYSEERIQQTMDRQLSEEEFKARCDYQIENNGEIEKTCRQIAERVREYENM